MRFLRWLLIPYTWTSLHKSQGWQDSWGINLLYIVIQQRKENALVNLLSIETQFSNFENKGAIQVVNLVQLSKIIEDQKIKFSELKNAKNVELHQSLFLQTMLQTHGEKLKIFLSLELGKQLIFYVHKSCRYIGHEKSWLLLTHIICSMVLILLLTTSAILAKSVLLAKPIVVGSLVPYWNWAQLWPHIRLCLWT